MSRKMNKNSYMLLSVGALLILVGPMIVGGGSTVKDVTSGILMGLGVVVAAVGLLRVRSKKQSISNQEV